jgi:hypothetical protein
MVHADLEEIKKVCYPTLTFHKAELLNDRFPLYERGDY